MKLKENLMDGIEGIKEAEGVSEGMSEVIKKTFAEVDDLYRKLYKDEANSCGATAVITLIAGNRLYCAGLGDARCVVSRNGKAIDMSRDHKSSDKEEQERIKK